VPLLDALDCPGAHLLVGPEPRWWTLGPPRVRTGQRSPSASSRVPPSRLPGYEEGVNDPAPSLTPSRSLFIGAISVLLLFIPFLVFGLTFVDIKARVVLQCEKGGPCTVTRAGWLTQEVVGIFPVGEIQGARVDRSRATRGEQQSIYRPVLLTTRGEIPLSYEWMGDEKQANRPVISINQFTRTGQFPAFTMWHDDRPRAARMGVLFMVVSGLVLLLGLFLLWRAFRRRKQERAQATGT